ncbi:MAG: selenium cofactor biosynthesis protein YqeC [Candidatus Eremiobacteraeota bacterium]|nr:selenium cofactor biosynthesis protein YqeC [Candidatus Eremiobacteraeota bacterium]
MPKAASVRECATWCEAFGLRSREHIALVGGGGKTTTLWSLARELARERLTIASATTKAGAPPNDVWLVLWHEGMPPDALRAAVGETGLIALGERSRPDRLQQVDTSALDFLFEQCGAQIVNEADGARMKPFKAPAGHEPVLGQTTTLAVIVVGQDAIGAPLDAEHLHRPELFAHVSGIARGETVQAQHVTAIIAHYITRVKAQAPSAECAVLINKADHGPGGSAAELAALLGDLPLRATVAAAQHRATPRLWQL